jgi:hypothetical protein
LITAARHICEANFVVKEHSNTMSNVHENGLFRVTGGVPLSGEIFPQGNKNEALPVLAAACLTDEAVTLENLPAIADVAVMQEILRVLGVRVSHEAGQCVVQATSRPGGDLPAALCARLRGAVTLAGRYWPGWAGSFCPSPAATGSGGVGSIRACSLCRRSARRSKCDRTAMSCGRARSSVRMCCSTRLQ